MIMDIDNIRAETPGVQQVKHFNNAGSSLVPRAVSQAVFDYLREEELYGGYEVEAKYKLQLEDTYAQTAKLINAQPGEIAYMESATAAWGAAFYAIPFKAGDIILTGLSEYASNYIPFLQLKKRLGLEIQIISDDSYGQISVDHLKNMITDRVKLIAITHIPTNGGLVNPAQEIGEIANNAGIWYLLDACQSVGQYPVDVKKIGCQILSATGRKFLRAPRGSGFLFVDDNILSQLEPEQLDMHGATWTATDGYEMRRDARRFELWESSYALKMGFRAAVIYTLELGIENIWERVQSLGQMFRERLMQVDRVELHDKGKEKCGIVTFSVKDQDGSHIKRELAKHQINVSISPSNSTLLDMQERKLPELVRASIHYYNTEEEIEFFAQKLAEIVRD